MNLRTRTWLWIVAAAALVASYAVFAKRQARDVDGGTTPAGRPRIVALVSGVVDTLSVLDSLDCLVAVGTNRTMDFPGTEGKPRILADERGGMTSAEGILALRPDYVFVARELAPSLEGRGLNVVTVPQDSMAQMREFVLSLGRIVGKEVEARAALEHMDAKMDEIRKRVAGRPRVRVYWEDTALGRTRGPGTAVHEMIELAGGENIYGDARIARPTIGAETILGADPEVIVLMTTSASPAEVKARQGWDKISAVENGRVFVVPFEERSVTLFSPRCADCCERTFLRWFHPELFPAEGAAMTRVRGVGAVVAAGIVATVLVAAGSLCLGAVDVPFASVIQALTGLKPFGAPASERDLTVIYEMRLTRVLAGLCVGGALGGAGCMLQALLRNPLASPQAMSASNAAAFGAVGALFLGLPFAATLGAGFACAAVAVVLVLLFARSHDGVPTDSIVLSGLNMSLLFGAMTGLVQYAAKSDSQLRDMVLWLLGGLWRVTWGPLAVAGPLTVVALVAVFPLTRDLDLFAVGEDDAARLGVNVKRSRVLLLVTACLLTALAVGLAGVVAFVGLVVPHAARKLVGASHRLAFPASVFLGAILVVAADAVARTLFVPSELPLGVVTSLVGVPVFFVLMRSRRRGAVAR